VGANAIDPTPDGNPSPGDPTLTASPSPGGPSTLPFAPDKWNFSGRTFGDYELLEEIARGGMGVVFKARQISLNRIVALKMILAGHLASREDVQRFHREAEAAANLDHPNLVPIYEVGEYQGQQYFSMKFIEGGNLAQHAEDFGLPPLHPRTHQDAKGRAWTAADVTRRVERAVTLMARVTRAVHYAHQRGLLHRDLKPANVLLDLEGQPHVTDFGLAKRLKGEAALTQSGAIVGTPGYVAPEQARAEKGLTTAVDVYSMGAILYELLVGRPPFRADTPLDAFLQVLEREPERPRQLQPCLDADLETICLKCLERDPQRRYGSAEALADDLERWLRREPIAARPVSGPERLWRWCQRKPGLAALSAAVAILLVATSVISTVAALRINALWEEARENAAQAEKAAAEAATAKSLADLDRDRADRERNEKEQQRKQAEAERARAEASLYLNRVAQAAGYWSAGDFRQADLKLDECPPELRGWEWHYLKRLLHSELATVAAPEEQIGRIVVLGSGGRRAASFCNELAGTGFNQRVGRVKVWDTETGQEIQTFGEFPLSGLRAIALSPDGKRVAAAGEDRMVKVWDVDQGTEIAEGKGFQGLIGPNNALTFSPDGKRLAAGSDDKTVRIWDAADGKEIQAIPIEVGEIVGVAFSPDGNQVAVAGAVALGIWDAAGKKKFGTPIRKGEALRVVYAPEGKRLALAARDGICRIWEPEKGEIRSLIGHVGAINDLAFSPDGTRLATAGEDKTIRVWNLGTNRELFVLRGHARPVLALAYGAEGQRLTSLGEDKTLKVWDAITGRQSLRLEAGPSGLAFSPDGKTIALASNQDKGVVRLHDVATGKEIRRLTGHRGTVRKLAFNARGNTLAVVCDPRHDAELSIRAELTTWDLATGQSILRQKNLQAEEATIAFSAEGSRLAVLGEGTAVILCNLETGVLDGVSHLGLFESLTHVALSTDGKRFAVTGRSQLADLGLSSYLVQICDTQTGKVLSTCRGHKSPVTCLAFSPADPSGQTEYLASADEDQTILLWNLSRQGETGTENSKRGLMRTPQAQLGGHAWPVHCLAFSRDARRLASISSDGKSGGEIKVWAVPSGQEVLHVPLGGEEVVFSPDGDRLAAGCGDQTVRIWDGTPGRELLALREAGSLLALSADGRLLATARFAEDVAIRESASGRVIATHKARPAKHLALSPDGKRLAVGGEDGTVEIRETLSGKLLHRLKADAEETLWVAFSPDGSILASAGADGVVRLWDVASGQPTGSFTGHTDRVLCVAFHPDGKRLVSCGDDGTVRFWEAANGREIFRGQGHHGFVNAVTFSRDGSLLASAGEDRTAKLWNPATGQEIRTFTGHEDGIRDLAFSPDGKRLATAGWDRSLRLWDVATGKALEIITGSSEGLTRVWFAPDGKRLLSAGADLTVRTWNVGSREK
jgi:WD40 repeat protein/serine/threonine protein kinase